MNCSKPLLFDVIGINKETGKKIVRPVRFWNHLKENEENHNFIRVPCGKCLACKLNYASEWSERIVLEASLYEKNSFITLTYSDDNLPDVIKNDETGELYHPLVKRDVQLFIKRLRKYFSGQKIRFFCAGEYGSLTSRPHYHLILFNCDFEDKKKFFYNRSTACRTYRSETLEKLWTYGISSIGEVTSSSANYCARYTLKKSGFGAKEFVLMSRRPGIGYEYFNLHKDEIYMTDKLYFNFNKNKHFTKPSRYYDKLLEAYNLELFKNVKESREVLGQVVSENNLRFHNTSYLEVVNEKNDELLKKKTKKLFKDKI